MKDRVETQRMLPDIMPVTEDFFHRPTLELAKSLLGQILAKVSDQGLACGYIVETEAYIGPMDRAAHSYQNRRTKRTEIMFSEPGRVYTYQMHTHCLVNVVSNEIDKPEAVLIRALEPLYGIEWMKKQRGTEDIKNLTNGPGKLTKALGINMEDYGGKLWEWPTFIAEGTVPQQISQGKRIGIENSQEARDYPWRFWVTGNPFVSRNPKKKRNL